MNKLDIVKGERFYKEFHLITDDDVDINDFTLVFRVWEDNQNTLTVSSRCGGIYTTEPMHFCVELSENQTKRIQKSGMYDVIGLHPNHGIVHIAKALTEVS